MTRRARRTIAWLVSALILLNLGEALRGAEESLPENLAALDVEADQYEFETDTGWASAEGNVHMQYKGMVLECDSARVNTKTKEVAARGNIYFYTLEAPDLPMLEQGVFWRGEELTGNFETREFHTGKHRVAAGVWYETGDEAIYQGSGAVVFHNVSLSTCEHLHTQHAHYSFNARKVMYTPDGKVRVYNAVYKVGRIPLLYWPYLSWDTDKGGGNIAVRGGFSSDWGAYLRLARKWRLSDHGDTTFMLDLRAKRGLAVGNRTRYTTPRSETDFLVYGMVDSQPPETDGVEGYNRRFEVEDGRFRANLSHRHLLKENWTLRLNADIMSDIDFLEEWFGETFDDYGQPRSLFDLRYDHERFTASLSARARLNTFYTAVERLPEFKLELPRQALWDTGFYYEGTTSAAYLRRQWREFDLDRAPGLVDPANYEALRLDSLNMLYHPFDFMDHVQIVPRAGFRLTYYDTSSKSPVTAAHLAGMAAADDPDQPGTTVSVTNYDEDGGDRFRLIGETGIEASTKFYRVWDDARSEFWQVNGLRHIIQPTLNYTYLSEPTEDRDQLFYFDQIDRLAEQHFVRVGLNQRLQTRRGEAAAIYTLAELETYADFHFQDRGGDARLGDFVTRVRIRPRPDVTLWGTVVANMDRGALDRVQIGAGFGTPDRLRLDISYLYQNDAIQDSLFAMGSTLADEAGENVTALALDENHYLNLALAFRITDKMRGDIRYEYDFIENDLARQVYQVTRDLHCWMGALRLEEEDHETTIQLLLWLKAFPRLGVDAGGSESGLSM